MVNIVCPWSGLRLEASRCSCLYISSVQPPLFSPQNPAIADIYTEHAHQVVVAKYAPSGFYIASGGNSECRSWTHVWPR